MSSSDVYFRPHLLVSSADGGSYTLVIEVKRGGADLESVEQLKGYMVSTGCPLGLLVTSESIEFLRDSYEDFTSAAVKSIGIFDTPPGLAILAASDAPSFEWAVQDWVDELRTQRARAQLDEPLRRAVEDYLLPVLYEGEVFVAQPREVHARAS